MQNDKVQEIIEKWDKKSEHTTEMLLDVQSEFNHLPEEALCKISDELRVPLDKLYNIVNSNKTFNLSPDGYEPVKPTRARYRYVIPGWSKPW